MYNDEYIHTRNNYTDSNVCKTDNKLSYLERLKIMIKISLDLREREEWKIKTEWLLLMNCRHGSSQALDKKEEKVTHYRCRLVYFKMDDLGLKKAMINQYKK